MEVTFADFKGALMEHVNTAKAGEDVIVTHKGVLRASLVLALAWDMRGKPPVRYDPERALIHDLGPSGELTFVASIPLREASA